MTDELLGAKPSRQADGEDSVQPQGSAVDPVGWQAFIEQIRTRGPHWQRFDLRGEIARGGMGSIHEVRDENLRRTLAMKVLLSSESDAADRSDASLGRFLEEAQVTSQLDHPGIVPVHDIGVDRDSRVYFTMKLVQGEDLRTVFDRVRDHNDSGWNTTRALSMLLRVCEAMAYAHSKGVIHRDLKPANVMVGRYGETYVMDWGLAKVTGQADGRDLRIRQAPISSLVQSERNDPSHVTSDSPLVTMDGEVVGTPAFMAPEQALGRVEEMGAHSDVYAVGAMLYHLLTGQMPYLEPGDRISPRTMLARVQAGPPRSIHGLNREVPAELVAICDKAMARQISVRYPDMTALAQDLRAYLERRVVTAYESGAVAELKKWIARNRGITATAAAALVLIAALTTWFVFRLSTKERESRSHAEQARANEKTAIASKTEFDQLAGVVLLESALARERDLYPAWSDKVEAMEQWLAEDAAKLLELKPRLSMTLSSLEERVLPWTDEELQGDRTSHPRYAELAPLTLRVEEARRAQAVRSGRARPVLPELTELHGALANTTAYDLNELAWRRVNPEWKDRIFGEETIALVAAREALVRVENGDDSIPRARVLGTLAWASFANGLDEAARTRNDESQRIAPESDRYLYSRMGAMLEESIASWAGEAGAETLASLESKLAALDAELSIRRTWRFDQESEQFLFDTLSDLLAGIMALESGAKVDVEQRLPWARRIDGLTRDHPNAIYTWEEAREAMAAADGVLASEQYAEHPISLQPQPGLVPIGMNPVTLLWEFYDLRTAHDPASNLDPAEIMIPEHREDGTLEIGEETGLVFVLIPGGNYWIGAQAFDPNAPHHDPLAMANASPFHRVALDAYFLSRYEMTQGQWARLTGKYPSLYARDRTWWPQWDAEGREPDSTHPVESVSWEDCVSQLRRIGCRLPSEAQWEAACRAGTVTPWWTGTVLQDVDEAANLSDHYGKTHGNESWSNWEPELNDGSSVHARVGSYRANAFGLHDVMGNVMEWCLDTFSGYYNPGREGDGARLTADVSNRIYRGGSFYSTAHSARSAKRATAAPAQRDSSTGCRPARDLN